MQGSRRERQIGNGAALGVSVVIVWFAGYMGVSMSAEIGTVVGALAVGAATAIWAEGLKGVFVHIWEGDAHHGHQVTVETDTAAKVTVQEHEGPPPEQD